MVDFCPIWMKSTIKSNCLEFKLHMVDFLQSVRLKLFQLYGTVQVLWKYDKHNKQLVVRLAVYRASGLAGSYSCILRSTWRLSFAGRLKGANGGSENPIRILKQRKIGWWR